MCVLDVNCIVSLDRVAIAEELRDYYPGVSMPLGHDGYHHAEFGGELPTGVVEVLKSLGAEVLVYRHHGTVATVVNF